MNTEAANRIREIARKIRYTSKELKAEVEDSIVANLLATADSLDPRKGKFERRIVIIRRWEDDYECVLRRVPSGTNARDPDVLMEAWKTQIRVEFDETIYGGEVSAEETVLKFDGPIESEGGDWRFPATLTFFYNGPGWRAAHAKAREEESYYSDRPFDGWLVYAVFSEDGQVAGGWNLVEEE
jgi:hypothetical protein